MDIALPIAAIDRIVDLALEEDAARGDVTTRLTVGPGRLGVAHAAAREELAVAGLGVFARVFARVDSSIEVQRLAAEGAWVAAGARLATVRGRVAPILAGERVALNILQRMCGIASTTRRFVEAAARGGRARVCDTRKTTPGLRLLERYAVRCGGGHNHREDLCSGVLIKDNHLAACGGVRPAVLAAKAGAPHPLRIEVEVTTLAELDEALAAGADAVLLDNMDPGTMTEAVRRAAGHALVEASGGVRLETVEAIARTGVDVISVGALTHSARAADIALDLEP
ncbi:MAG: carboxylating nicotinate-nucleotide diphosphorylase [Deltaproteobacteria bacterium]|nr:carboxylating nicotinate-nucleotide diphosphorylase [Deltaproteobacteria bacterium]